MEFIGTIILLLIINLIWMGIKSGSKAAYSKVTEPSDTLKKTTKEAQRVTKSYSMNKAEAEQYQDIQKIGVIFSRLAMTVALADGHMDEAEFHSLISFFNGASESYIDFINGSIRRDLAKPTRIDWDHTIRSMKEMLKKENFRGFDLVLFDGLLSISQADGNISQSEIATIMGIMKSIGWDDTQCEAAFKSRFGFFEEEDTNDERIKEAYNVLGLEEGTNIDKVRERYKELAKSHHPDMVSSMGSRMERIATERFQKIQEAYQLIKAQL